eukprot:scaffold10789_cov141-Isochrysis_galbana.AAC.4
MSSARDAVSEMAAWLPHSEPKSSSTSEMRAASRPVRPALPSTASSYELTPSRAAARTISTVV